LVWVDKSRHWRGLGWVGLGRITEMMGWIGLGFEKRAHVQCLIPSICAETCNSAMEGRHDL
jgi:hypothetical protein